MTADDAKAEGFLAAALAGPAGHRAFDRGRLQLAYGRWLRHHHQQLKAREPLRELAVETLIEVPVSEQQDRVTELFDKYNLLALPVVDRHRKLTGVITADDIISVLRQR